METKICEKCNNPYKEKSLPMIRTEAEVSEDGITTRHEEEFFPYCEKCFKKELQRYKKSQWMLEMTRGKFINEEVIEKYKNGKLSHMEIDKLWREYQKCQ